MITFSIQKRNNIGNTCQSMNSMPKIGARFASINTITDTFVKAVLAILSHVNKGTIFRPPYIYVGCNIQVIRF